jgi:transcriptional regulator with XRE-family HTH domain
VSRNKPPSFEDLALQRELGNRVRLLRHERGWTQEALVDRSGLDRSYLSMIEAGTTNPSLRTLSRLATGLQVNIEDLFK